MFLEQRLKMDVSNIKFFLIFPKNRNKNVNNQMFYLILQNLYLFNVLFFDFPNHNLLFQKITLNILLTYLDNLLQVLLSLYLLFYQILMIISTHFLKIFIPLKFQLKFKIF